MVIVTWELGRSALVDPLTVTLVVVSGVALLRFPINPVWLVVAGG
jgi:chromate transporter